MSITKRALKDGIRFYEIRYSRGRDPLTGKQLTPYSTRYFPPVTWSDTRAEKEARIREAEFIADCKAGKILTKAEERQQRKEQAQAAERERLEAAAKPTFQAYGETWVKEAETVRSPGTVENYRVVLKRAGQVFNSIKMESITPYMVKEYLTSLYTDGTSALNGEKLHFKTKVKHYAVLHLFFQSAVESGVISFSPMRDMKRPKRPKDELPKERKAFSAEEVQYIRKCIAQEPLKWRAMVIFMLDSGCRRGEVVGLKWDAINFKTGEVTISRNAQYTAGRGTYIATPKNGKARSFYLNSQALTVMKEWQKQQALYLLGRGLPRNGYCFTREDGQMLNPQAPTAYFTRISKKYNIPGLHPHALRHTMATLSIANGADIVSISTKLGHSSPDITLQVYTHANEEAQRKANALLAEQLYKKA